MTTKRILGLFLVFLFSLSLFAGFAEALPARQRGPQMKQPPAQERVTVPKEIKAVLQEGLISRQGRQDIPFDIFQSLTFPARENLYPVFLFKAKNADLGFVPSADPAQPGLEARLNAFVQFLQEDGSGVPQVRLELYLPLAVQAESEGYDPEKAEWYSFGMAMLPGNYTLALAITSPDLQKVGVDYLDFVLPDPAAFQEALETTPIFFAKGMNQMEAVEQRPIIHKGMFTYANLQIEPYIDNIVPAGEMIELLFYIFGTKLKDTEAGMRPENDIEISFEVNKDDDSLPAEERIAVRWEPQKYNFALISQPLPLKQTVVITNEKGDQSTEQRDLEAGKYILDVKIKDNISGLTLDKAIPFEVK